MKSTMSNKKKGILITAILLIAAVAIGMTMAYFTDTATKTNQITMGKVIGDLQESSNSSSGSKVGEKQPSGGYTYKDIVPGDTISKIPTASLKEGSVPAWVRVNATYTLSNINASADSTTVQNNVNALITSINAELGEGWHATVATPATAVDGGSTTVTVTYYYDKVLAATENTTPIFETIKIPAEWDNNMTSTTLTIQLDAQFIQAENIKLGADNTSWTDKDGAALPSSVQITPALDK